ncbi:MAG: class B sortase [Oscillospiraceae bacterium]
MQKLKIIAFLAAAAAVFAAAAVLFYKKHNENTEEKRFKEQQTLFADISPNVTADETPPTVTAEEQKIKVDYLADARKINPQITAWITIPDTDIDFPVVQCEDNSYYLNHDFEQNESYMGTPFLDCRNNASFEDFNSIVYGHNISNKYMFAPLLNFKNADYFNSHPTGTLTTSDKIYTVRFIVCAVVESDSFAYEAVFLTDKDKLVFLDSLREIAVSLRDFSDDELLDKSFVTLSTCSYEYDGARTILVGVLDGDTNGSAEQ